MKKIFFIITILAPLLVKAQTTQDMFEFSTTYYHGTAKSAAMGNAMGAVGSDFSAIAINPAGLGLFRKATFTLTPEFYSTSTSSDYKGNSSQDKSFRLPLNNVGLTWTQQVNDGMLNSVSFALGINQLNNFSYNSYVNGNNPNTSLIDAYFTEMYANNITNAADLEYYSPNNIYSLYLTDLIDFGGTNPQQYLTFVPQGNLNQQYSMVKRGSAQEFSFASGFNFEEKWFLGVSLNIPFFDRDINTEYKERNLAAGSYFKYWDQEEFIETSGRGINARVGAIIYPSKWLRFGFAFHSPTYYKIDERWHTTTYALFSDGSEYDVSPTSTYSYTIMTPYRLNASAAFIFGNYGMITTDFDYIDYSRMQVSGSDDNYDFKPFNEYLRSLYNSTANIRIGTEWRWQSLCFRAGYAFYGSPYGLDKKDLRPNSYSLGFGYTHHRFTVDAAYVFSQRKNNYSLYSQYSMYPAYYGDNNEFVDDTNVKETTNMNQVVISFKFRLD